MESRLFLSLLSIEAVRSTILSHYLSHHSPIAVDASSWQTNVNSRCRQLRKDEPWSSPNDFDPEPHLLDTCRFFKYSSDAFESLLHTPMKMEQFMHFKESSSAYHKWLSLNTFEVRCRDVLRADDWFQEAERRRPHFRLVTRLFLADRPFGPFNIEAVQCVLEAFPNLTTIGFDLRDDTWAVINPEYEADWIELPGPPFLVKFLRKYCDFKGNVIVGGSRNTAGFISGNRWSAVFWFVEQWRKALIWEDDRDGDAKDRVEKEGNESDEEEEDDLEADLDGYVPVGPSPYDLTLDSIPVVMDFDPSVDGP